MPAADPPEVTAPLAQHLGFKSSSPTGKAGTPESVAARTRVRLDKTHRLLLRGDGAYFAREATTDSAQELLISETTWLSYEESPLWHRLQVGEASFTLAPRIGRRALRVIAVGRLRALSRARASTPPPFVHPFVRRDNGPADALLEAVRRSDEVVALWEKLSGRYHLTSKLGGQRRAQAFVLLSDQRCSRYLVSDAGDVGPEEPLALVANAPWLDQLPRSRKPRVDGIPANAPAWAREVLAEAAAVLGAVPQGLTWFPADPCPVPLAPHVALAETWVQLAQGSGGYSERVRQRALLSPMDMSWLQRLNDVAETPLAARVSRAMALLSGALEAPRSSDSRLKALSPQALTSAFQMGDGEGLGHRLKSWFSHSPAPELGTLRQFCERPREQNAPILRLVDQVATWLGLGHVEVFISRGHNDVGLHAIAGTPPFLLIGGQHLEPNSRYQLSQLALRAAVAAELTHVRLGNIRVAPDDVMRGALLRGKQGIDVALGVLPLVGSLRLANRLGVVTAKLTLPQVVRTLEAARAVPAALKQAEPQKHELSLPNETLLGSHRDLQLGADRAGLVCTDDLPAAVEAMLRVRTAYARIALDVPERGLLDALQSQREGQGPAIADLERRLGALFAFYLSDDYQRLVEQSRAD